MQEYDEYIKSFDIEAWLQPLKDVTFPTELIPLSFQDAQILHALCESVTALKKSLCITEDAEQRKALRQQIVNIHLSKLSQLASKIDAVIHKWRPSDNDDAADEKGKERAVDDGDFGVFVKLSSRSAKDASDAQERLQGLLDKYCAESKAESDNDRVAQLLKAATHCMKACHGERVKT